MDYKEISKLFIEYDGDVQINPFAKMHWGILKTEDTNINEQLVKEGHAVEYWGGKR